MTFITWQRRNCNYQVAIDCNPRCTEFIGKQKTVLMWELKFLDKQERNLVFKCIEKILIVECEKNIFEIFTNEMLKIYIWEATSLTQKWFFAIMLIPKKKVF